MVVGWASSEAGRTLNAFKKILAEDYSLPGLMRKMLAAKKGVPLTPAEVSDLKAQSEKFKETLSKDVLFPKRLGYATELASMVVECLTNSYMNAEVIRVDGGIRMQPK